METFYSISRIIEKDIICDSLMSNGKSHLEVIIVKISKSLIDR